MAVDSFNPTESLIPNDGDLVFDSTTGEGGRSPAETVLPYIEQRADPDTIYRDAGVVTTPDHADFTLGSPEENDGTSQGIIVDWRTSGPGDELTAGFCATGQTSADGSSPDVFPTETIKMTYGAIESTYAKDTAGVIAIIAPPDNDYGGHSVLEFSVENYPNNPSHSPGDVGHADLLFSADAMGGAGCSDVICGNNTPVLDSGYGASHLSLYDLIV
jgi:hypothetical protein